MSSINVNKKEIVEIQNQLKSVSKSIDSLYLFMGFDEEKEEDKEWIELESLLCSSIKKLSRIAQAQQTN